MKKRFLDLFVVIATLPVWGPLFLLVSFLIRWTIGSPVLFRQLRPGRSGQAFELLKFRTMSDARDIKGQLLPDAERLFPFGRWLRSISLDELPELLNVLRNEMSLVGPRPLLLRYLEHYTPEQARRHEVLPGLTGLAQVKGRNAISWEEKFRLDVWYVDNQSMWLDLQILAVTIKKVLSRDGISAPDEATAKEFSGSSGSEIRSQNSKIESQIMASPFARDPTDASRCETVHPQVDGDFAGLPRQ